MVLIVPLLILILLAILFPNFVKLIFWGFMFLISLALFFVSAHAEEAHGDPYEKAGVVNCSLPGTVINFALDGAGNAIVGDLSTNFSPLQKAAQVGPWAATTKNVGKLKILILDNRRQTRIMIDLPDGRGTAFVGEDGVSDILCQVLIEAN